MATAYTWSFAKRHNSTMQPTGTGTAITLNLKGGSDILAPVFLLNNSGIPSFNYFSFEGRFYFVTGVKNVRQDLWEISAEVDVLATFKSVIQNTSAHVLYYTHSNTEITDHRLSCKTTQSTSVSTGSFGNFGDDQGTPGYVLTVVGKESIAAYAVTESNLQNLIDQNFFDTLDNNIDNITPVDDSTDVMTTIADSVRWLTDLFKTEIGSFTYSDNASANIRACHLLPISYAAIGGTVEQIYLGRMNSGHTGLRITDRTYTDSATVSIPWQASDWRRNAPYHEIFLYIPAIGLTAISPSDVAGETSLTVKVSMDKLSGDAIVEVKTSTKTIAYYTSNFATPYPIGAAQITPLQASTAIGSAAAALAVSSNPALAGAMAGLGLANALQQNPTCIGSNAGGAILGVSASNVYCITIFHDTTVTPASVSAIMGTPFNGVVSLSGITGYVQTSGASVAGLMTDAERQQINELLDGGIYIE